MSTGIDFLFPGLPGPGVELAAVDLLPVLQDHDDDDDWAGDSDVLVLTKGRCSTTLDLDQLPLWWYVGSSGPLYEALVDVLVALEKIGWLLDLTHRLQES